MSKRTSFTTNIFLFLIGVVLLGVGQLTVSADEMERTSYLPFPNVLSIAGVVVLLLATFWFWNFSNSTENTKTKVKKEQDGS